MKIHIDKEIKFVIPENKNLYSWAISEYDAVVNRVSSEQIPWPWSIYFKAIACITSDDLTLRPKGGSADEPSAFDLKEKLHRRRIVFLLEPIDIQFSMFGTSRIIKTFELSIHPIEPNYQNERCTSWGSVSNTVDTDFRDETTEDLLGFEMYVSIEEFGRYESIASSRDFDSVMFRVKGVDGFYSEWSPSISTYRVKVLTQGGEHDVALPSSMSINLPRLGLIEEASLQVSRRIDLEKRIETLDASPEDDVPTNESVSETPTGSAEAITAEHLAALKANGRAIWVVVIILVLLLVTVLVR